MGNLVQLAYVCRAQSAADTIAQALRWSTTSFMQVSLYGQGCFFQCIEGPAKQINHIFQQLANLPIGFDLQVLTWHDLASAQLTHSGTHYLVENLPVHTLLTRHGIAAKEAVYLHELIHIFQNHVQSPLVDPSKPTTSGAGGARQFC